MKTCNDCICFNSCYWAIPDDPRQICEDFDDRTEVYKVITKIEYHLPEISDEVIQQAILEEGLEDIVTPNLVLCAEKFFEDENVRYILQTIESHNMDFKLKKE